MAQRTVLLVEDEALIAIDIAMELEALGLKVIQTTTIADALAAVEKNDIQAAVLDLDIRGEPTDSVALALRARRVPFMVCSGSQFADLAEIFAGVPTVAKPFRSEELNSTLLTLMEGRAP